MARPKTIRSIAAFGVAALASCFAAPDDARAQGEPESSSQEQPARHVHVFDRTEGTNPLRGSSFFFEQSITTQTVGVGDTPQSEVPLYELWLSLRPRYWFDDHWSVRLRADYTKELTNDEQTTTYRQDLFGDIWTDGVYFAKLDSLWEATRADAGLRALWPTSLESQAAGIYVKVGPRAGMSHEFALNGNDARWFENVHVALRATDLYTFSTATTPTDFGTFGYTRQTADGVSFLSDQVSGQTLVRDELQLFVEAGLQIAPALSFTMFAVLFSDWHDSPSSQGVATGTGQSAGPQAPDQQFTQKTWWVAGLDYDVLDELQLGLGYYNLANAIAPDGAQRGLFGSDTIWWSPDARFFFSATANLDVLYTDVTRPRAKAPSQAAR